MTEKVSDTDMCIYLEIHAHMHQIMFTNAYRCILLDYIVVTIA